MTKDIEFKRTLEKVKEAADKINTLIEIYAEKEGLLPYLSKKTVAFKIDVDGMLIDIKMYRIEVTKFCSESIDILMREYYEILSSFASNTELEDQLAARYLPDYLTMKNIFSILLYEVPRKMRKSDLEHLNKLYKKYNVKFL